MFFDTFLMKMIKSYKQSESEMCLFLCHRRNNVAETVRMWATEKPLLEGILQVNAGYMVEREEE